MNVLNWINKARNCHNMFLSTLVDEVHHLVARFDLCLCRHVYIERNSTVYKLYKEGLQLAYGKWKISEAQNGTFL